MTSRERVMAALAHREPDRTPFFEYVLQSPVADHFLGHRYAYGEYWDELVREKGWEPALRQLARDVVSLAKTLGHDLVYVHAQASPVASGRVRLPRRSAIPPDLARHRTGENRLRPAG